MDKKDLSVGSKPFKARRFSSAEAARTELYGSDTLVIENEGERIVYSVKNETGCGSITQYQVFPGIDLFYNDFHMSDGFNQNKLPVPDMLEINHCKEGRFECSFENGGHEYLGAGDLALSSLADRTVATSFPLNHYHGISIVISLRESRSTIQNFAEGLGLTSVDPVLIQSRLCGGNSSFMMRATDSIQHIFSELYTAPESVRQDYFKLKVMELLLFLSAIDPSENEQGRRYFKNTQVETIYAIERFLTNNLDQNPSLTELAERFDIPLTSMKTCFKGVYGMPIHAYLRSYRLRAAAQLLRETDIPIMDCSVSMGYSNPSKFSEAFRKEIGMLPSEYRKAAEAGKLVKEPYDSCHPR